MMTTGQPWTATEVALLGTMTDRAVAERSGRSVRAVETKRLDLGIAAHTAHRRHWSRAELRLLGRMTDGAVAERLGIARRTVLIERGRRGIAAYLGRVKR